MKIIGITVFAFLVGFVVGVYEIVSTVASMLDKQKDIFEAFD